MYNLIIQRLYTPLCAHHPESGLVCHHVFDLFTLFVVSLPHPPLITTICCLYLWVCFICSVVFLFYIPHISEIIYSLFFLWYWLTLLNMIFCRSIHISVRAIFQLFYGWVVFHCTAVPYPLCPIICWRTLGYFHVLAAMGNAEWLLRCRCTYIDTSQCFQVFQVDTQKRVCWVI